MRSLLMTLVAALALLTLTGAEVCAGGKGGRSNYRPSGRHSHAHKKHGKKKKMDKRRHDSRNKHGKDARGREEERRKDRHERREKDRRENREDRLRGEDMDRTEAAGLAGLGGKAAIHGTRLC
jgi:hypothetical protein